jgi:glycerol-3-phosphate dehydrogenase
MAYTLGLAGAAAGAGVQLRTEAHVDALARVGGRIAAGLADGERVTCDVAVNCAGLHADEVARLAGDESFEIYPRKGEFLVFDPPGGRPLEHILLPVPARRTKGILVFPTLDGQVVAGPTAHDQEDKDDWSVRDEARREIMSKARRMVPELEGVEPIAAYAGLRPAGRGVNYLIAPSAACAGLINVAAIRSTGVSASLGIAERVLELVASHGVALGPERPLPAPPSPPTRPWWQRTARHRAAA